MVICTLIYLVTTFSIYSVSVIINNMHFSHSFVGLTFSCWGGNVADIMNGMAAAKLRKIELAVQTIIGSQIINLHLCLGVPWLLYNLTQGVLHFPPGQMFSSMMTVFLVVILSLLILRLGRHRLSYQTGGALVALYLVFFGLEWTYNNA